ncbi:MAG TPA: TetR-like C-terminal domain-containing protein [Candidatus Angelobacter sp.]|nr:TetR-like C-terminal domain-containing protein [Candidatus Angelobacter sp.]
MDLGVAHLARGIEKRLGTIQATEGMPQVRVQTVAHALSGALFSMLTWWLDRGMPESPDAMDDLYHQLVWSGAIAVFQRPLSKASRAANR